MRAQSDLGRFDGNGPILPLLFFLAPLVTSVLPRLTFLFLFLICLTLLLPSLRRGEGLKQLLPLNSALAACLVLSLYVFVNALWAIDQADALSKAAVLFGAILIGFAGMPIFATLSESQISRTALAFVVGAAIGALYLWLELVTEGALYRAIVNTLDLPLGEAKRIDIVGGEVTRIGMSEFNPNATMLMFHLWPGLLILGVYKAIRRRMLMSVLFFAAFAVTLLISDHDSSQLALLGSTLALIVARYWPRAVTRALAVLWALGFLLVLPLNFLAYKAEMHLVEPLPSSYKARIIIWEYTSERVLEHPWLGIGVNSTGQMKKLPNDKIKYPSPEKPKGFVFKRTTAHHAHSVFLQTWYELGIVGAILLAAAGAFVVLRIELLPLQAQPFAAATFVAFVVIASFAWGMWQTWFMCATALTALYLGIAAATARETAAEADPAYKRHPA
jgi:O-Antigen ligase